MDKLELTGYITDWDPTPEQTLSVANWFEVEYTEVKLDVDDKSMIGWFLAQGWVIYDQYENTTVGRAETVVNSYTYYLKRKKLQSDRVLQEMINEFTKAYNEGRSLNDSRYDELVTIYSTVLDKTEDEIASLDSGDDTYSELVVSLLGSLEDDYDEFKAAADAIVSLFESSHNAYKTIVDSAQSEMESDQAAYKTLIQSIISLLSAAFGSYQSTIDSLLSDVEDRHPVYESLVDGVLTSIGTDYDTLYAVVGAILDNVEADFSEFSSDMDGILDDYGDSMREQINTRFDNELTKSRQSLTDRGMYNTTTWNTIEVGIERERSLALSDLEDKLTQQQLAVLKTVYGEQARMRQSIMDERNRLFDRLQSVRGNKLNAHSRIYDTFNQSKGVMINTLQQVQGQLQQVYGDRINAQSRIYETKANVTSKVLAADDRVQSHLDMVRDKRLQAEERLYAARRDMRTQIISARDRLQSYLVSATDRRLELRNRVAFTLTQFMERRTDDYPGIGQLADLAAGLGYSEGGTVSTR